MNLYLAGYLGHTQNELERQIAGLNAVIADIRINPASRLAGWGFRALARQFDPHYFWLPELGNLNYKSGGPVKLKALDEGMARLYDLLKRYERVILLCACRDQEKCHRLVVARLMIERYPTAGISFEPLEW